MCKRGMSLCLEITNAGLLYQKAGPLIGRYRGNIIYLGPGTKEPGIRGPSDRYQSALPKSC